LFYAQKILSSFFEPREPAFFLSFYVCLSSFSFLSSRFFYFSSSFNSCFFCFCYFCFCSFNLLFCGCLCSFYLSSCFSFCSFNFCLHRRNRFCSNSLNCSGCSSRCYLSFSCHCRCRSCYDCSRKHCFKHVHINPLRK